VLISVISGKNTFETASSLKDKAPALHIASVDACFDLRRSGTLQRARKQAFFTQVQRSILATLPLFILFVKLPFS